MGGIQMTEAKPVVVRTCTDEITYVHQEDSQDQTSSEVAQVSGYDRMIEMFTMGRDYSDYDLPPGIVVIPPTQTIPDTTPEVPIPASWGLLVLGVLAFLMVVRPYKKKGMFF